ncbi:MAG TPA: GAF domain-containing protein [Terriglobales bacterium]|nr:GAF domain-containing protein [Terriglobales bacterium]
MELSSIRLQDVPARDLSADRRYRIRHRPHTPAYASFNHSSAGMVVDLSELIDLHEDGFAVQASRRLPVNQNMSITLDLPETKALIPCSGQVVWSDGAGRAGIRFSGLTDGARRLLKEWLFINLMVACTVAARRQRAARPVETLPTESRPAESRPVPSPVPSPIPDLTGMLSAIEAVRREVRATGDNLDSAFRLITERALSLTGATGAALAFLTDDKMVCRAQAGEPAPPIGAAVDVKHGASGECVRTGRMIKCDDTDTDSRVERDLCRILGIGSILAAPILSDFRVVGLIEVFSPRAHAFTDVQETALDRLVEIVPKAKAEVKSIPSSEHAPAGESESSAHAIREALWEPEAEAQEPLTGVPVRPLHLVLLVLTAAVTALVLGYLLAPTIEKWWLKKPNAAAAPTTVSAATPTANANSPEGLRMLAEQGDADAQWSLGVRYHTGDGFVQDDAQAVQWFLRAAEQGHVSAQATLGAYYWAGRGVQQDLSKAYFWSALALARGDDDSKSRLEGLSSQMTRAQVAAARQDAEEWLRQHHAQSSK